jgi:ABC-type polysaccharide/polyol phosphate export permease
MTAVTHALRDGLIVTQRNLIKVKRIPDLLIFSTIQPIMFVLLFAYVFGSAIDVPGVSYREFLMAGVFTQTVAFGSAFTSIGLAEDLQKGVIDRFRSLPMSRAAVLIGRTTSDLVNNAFVLIVMSAAGLIVGWRIHTNVFEAAAGFGIMLLFAFALSWVSALIGLSVRTVEVAQSAGFIWLFPVTFISNAFVPTDNMPLVLKKVAEWNPVTAVSTSCRKLFGNTNETIAPLHGWPNEHSELLAIGWSLLLIAVFVPLSVRKYRAAAAR